MRRGLTIIAVAVIVVFWALIGTGCSKDSKYKSFEIEIASKIEDVNFDDLYDDILDKSDASSVYVHLESEMFFVTDKNGTIKEFNIEIIIEKDGEYSFYSPEDNKVTSTYKIKFSGMSYKEDDSQEKMELSEFISLFNYVKMNTISSYYSVPSEHQESDLIFNFSFNFLESAEQFDCEGINQNGEKEAINQSYQGKYTVFKIGALTYYEKIRTTKSLNTYRIIPENKRVS